jgi:hypothetical protein
MNYSDLCTIERFRPAQPANDRGARQPRAPMRPHADTRDNRGSNEDPVEIRRYIDLKKGLKPLRYTIDRIVCRGRVYTLTGPTNAGKTTWCSMAALAVATGWYNILNLGVERGRVLYLAIENPYDTVSRFMFAQRVYGILNPTLHDRLFIVTVKATPEDVFTALKRLAKSGPFALIIVDTLAAYFDGTDLNNNVEVGDFIRRLRQLTTVLGEPSVVIPAHPIKGATQASLSPYGGGAIINEVDGKLTLWRRGNFCKLHWQTKFRGHDFDPVFFGFRNFGCNEVRDAKGRRVIMPLLVPLRRGAAEPAERLALPAPARLQPRPQQEHRAPLLLRDLSQDRQGSARSATATPDTKLLRAMIANPNATQAEWARATGVATSNVNRRLGRLEGEGLVQRARGRWTVTETGRRAVRPAQTKTPPVASSR